MRPFVTMELLMIVAVVVLLTSFPLLDYGLREGTAAATVAGGVLALIGFAMPLVARICCPMPEEKQAAGEQEQA